MVSASFQHGSRHQQAGTNQSTMADSRIGYLISKELQGDLSEREQAELYDWIGSSEANRRWYEDIRDRTNVVNDFIVLEHAAAEEEDALSMVSQQVEGPAPAKVVRGRFGRRILWRVAAAVVIVLGSGSLWYFLEGRRTEHRDLQVAVSSPDDVAPGSNKAVLTLANGSTIVLDSAGTGALATQGHTRVLKLDSGAIAYQADAAASKEVLYNMITTPRGGQYKLILPDGSRVWLNAASALRYPIAFTGSTRSVELVSGEAYFEVARHPSQPFTVRVPAARQGDRDLTVDVLGTSFDLNAYPDEPRTKATVLTGSIRVGNGGATALLHPGEQAESEPGGTMEVDPAADVAGVIAWKDGLFSFDRAGIEVIMRQLARWYDVEVTYEGKVPVRQFVGTIPRDVPASVVLKALEYNNVHFKIAGKKIIVTP